MSSQLTTERKATKIRKVYGERRFVWVVEFEVSETWVADGFEMTDERAIDMLAHDLNYANVDTELGAKVLRSPNHKEVRKAQGYES